MRTKVRVLALLTTATIGAVHASEWRTPWISERGPIRYTFEKLHTGKKECNMNLWSSTSMKEAHKAFMGDNFKTRPITALLFNESDFQISGIFENGKMGRNTEFYNPFMNVTTFQPRATYMEYGINLGGRIDYPVYGYKGRIGLRASLPFRYIQIQRDDTSDSLTDPMEDVHASTYVTVVDDTNGQANGNQATQVEAEAWRLDFINSLNMADGSPLLSYNTYDDGTPQNVTIAGSDITVVPTVDQTDKSPSIAFVQSDANSTLPYYGWQWDTTNVDGLTATKNIATVGSVAADNIAGIPTVGTITPDYLNVMTSETDYATLLNGEPTQPLNTVWLVGRYATDSQTPSKRTQSSNAIFNAIDFYSRAHSTCIFDFMAGNNFVFETKDRSGMGDFDADIFYEHTFSKAVMGEVSVGMKVPTDSSKDHGIYNPYKPRLGNGGHWEVKVGAMLAWQPSSWMNAKLDSYFSAVLQATEKRVATFAGSTIKNIGPRADAEVDWSYFVTRLDFNFFHPKTDTIRSTVGYELYYKTKDHITFKQKQLAQGWEGRQITTDPITEITSFTDKPLNLDNALASKNTEAMSHKIRFETAFQVMKYFEIFCGGSTTFAGQYVFCDHDAHGGFNIRF